MFRDKPRRTLLTIIAFLTTPIGGIPSAWTSERLQCLSAPAKPSSLPSQIPIGIETIHRDPQKIITIYVPLAPNGTPSKILDTNDKTAHAPTQRRLIMSDGTVFTAFVGADTRPGSRLALCLTEIQGRIPSPTKERALEFIRDHLQDDFLKEPPAHYVFAWDKNRKPVSEELLELFHAAKGLVVGHYPLRSHQLQDVVPLEKFLEAGYGTCLHKALLASLLLDQLGIPHRLVNGATRSIGHTWIELKDGTILDPSLKKLERPSPSVAFPGWIKYGESIVFENQVWPYLELD